MEDLIKGLIRTLLVQHQDFISKGNYVAWLNHFALMFRLQKDLKIFTEEEWGIIKQKDLPSFLEKRPEVIITWKANGLREHWTQDVQDFIDKAIERVEVAQ